MVLVLPAALAIVGGALLLASGVAGSVGLYGFLLGLLAKLVPSPYDAIFYWAILVLSFFASLGGGSVIIGGIFLGRGRLTTGKLLVRLGCGTGLFGFLIQLASRALKGLEVLMAFLYSLTGSLGGIGLLLCLSSMLLARKPPKKVGKKAVYRVIRPLSLS